MKSTESAIKSFIDYYGEISVKSLSKFFDVSDSWIYRIRSQYMKEKEQEDNYE